MSENVSNNKISKDELANEQEVISLLKLEASSFVPDVLEKVTNKVTVQNAEHLEDILFLKNKIHAESECIVPKLQKNIIKATKAEKPFRHWMRQHYIGIYSGLAASFIAIAAISTCCYYKQMFACKEGSYVSIRISANEASKEKSPYLLSFSYCVDKDGKVNYSTFKANNYSANLLKKSFSVTASQSIDEAVFAASLLKPSYEKGYILEGSATSPNQIEVIYFGREKLEEKEKAYKKAFDKALRQSENGIGAYAKLNFVNPLKNKPNNEADQLDEKTKISVARVYDGFTLQDGDSLVSLETLTKEEETTLDAISETIEKIQGIQASPMMLQGLIRGNASAYVSSLCKESKNYREEIEAKKNELIENFDGSLFKREDETSISVAKEFLQKDSAYLVEIPNNAKVETESESFFSLYKEIRSLINKNLDDDSYLSLLEEEKNIADSYSPLLDMCQCFDDVPPADDGNHKIEKKVPSSDGGLVD